MAKKRIKSIQIGIAIFILLCGIGGYAYLLWQGGGFLPQWITWENRIYESTDKAYTASLKKQSVTIQYAGEVIWNSPDNIKVQDMLSCDIDHDKQEELVMLCWKRGRYGEHRPFWVEQEEKAWSQHIFVYEYTPEGMLPKWMSSYLGLEVVSMGDNGREAPWVRVWLTDTAGEVSSWAWDSWGFTRQKTEVSFAAFGDVVVHEPIYRYGLKHREDFSFLFENVTELIRTKDVAVINLETPLTENPALYSSYPRFGTPAMVGEAIIDAGFDVVTCATNHAMDQGKAGILYTKELFEKDGVLCLGIHDGETQKKTYEVIVRNGIRFALLNYTYGTNGIPLPEPEMVSLLDNEERIAGEIRQAKEEADMVMVFVHWGTEYENLPDELQKKWTGLFLENDVDVVIGTHPHAIQPYEMLTDDSGHRMLIYYSLGDYISAQSEKKYVMGAMAEFTVDLTESGYQVTEYGLLPLTIQWEEGGKYTVELSD